MSNNTKPITQQLSDIAAAERAQLQRKYVALVKQGETVNATELYSTMKALGIKADAYDLHVAAIRRHADALAMVSRYHAALAEAEKAEKRLQEIDQELAAHPLTKERKEVHIKALLAHTAANDNCGGEANAAGIRREHPFLFGEDK
jgi:hypothetical protein